MIPWDIYILDNTLIIVYILYVILDSYDCYCEIKYLVILNKRFVNENK